MLNTMLKEAVLRRVLPRVQTPAQYIGGELNVVVKDHRSVEGRLVLGFPDAYTVGTSHHGLQVLYTLMNERADWVCERVFCPWQDMEAGLRREGLKLYGLESFTPISDYDVFALTLQYEISYSNILTMLDLGGIALRSVDRGLDVPLVVAGGPCAQNPEPIAPFCDVFVTGDGEPSLPLICDFWLAKKKEALQDGPLPTGEAGRRMREAWLLEMAQALPFAYVPRFYEPEYAADGLLAALHRTHPAAPATIEPSVVGDLDGIPLPLKPIVPYVESVHDRLSIEIMRGCPWQCRFCQSTVIKRPMRVRKVETIVRSALAMYQATGTDDVSLLSLSSSDYPYFVELVQRMKEVFTPLGVNVSLPSLRVNEILESVIALMSSEIKSGLTLAPEVARDDMREQIRKKIRNDDLYNGCRKAFQLGWKKVKLYFLCGLPGEREVDLDGIVDMAERIARIGKEELGRWPEVTASVSNFVPKPHTPYQWNGMQTKEYFQAAHLHLWKRRTLRCINIKCHDIETSLLEGLLTRGDRRVADVIETVWRRGARFDAWHEHFNPQAWRAAVEDVGLGFEQIVHRPYPMYTTRLPWDHLNVKKGRTFLEKEQERSVVQLAAMAGAT